MDKTLARETLYLGKAAFGGFGRGGCGDRKGTPVKERN